MKKHRKNKYSYTTIIPLNLNLVFVIIIQLKIIVEMYEPEALAKILILTLFNRSKMFKIFLHFFSYL